MMDPVSREELDRITMLTPEELSLKEHAGDVAFLRARRAYLRPEQAKVFEPLLKGVESMGAREQAAFEKADGRERARAAKEAEKEAKKTKTVQESQNPGGGA